MATPRRVLLVEKSFGLSGSTISLATLLKHLDRDAYIPGAAVSRAEQRDFLRERVERLATIEVVSERPSFANGPRWARLLAFTQRRLPTLRRPLLWFIAVLDVCFSTMPYALRLARIGRHWRADLVHQNNGFDLGAFFATALMRVPLVVFQRGSEPRSLTSRLLAPRVDRYVANSNATRTSLLAVGVPSAKIEVVYPPIDLSRFDPDRSARLRRADLHLDATAPCFGIVGQLVEWKGHRVFLDAARRVLTEMPSAYALIVGDAPPDRSAYRAALEEQAERLGISSHVRFLGFREDVADVVRLMDVVVHASLYPEPFGRVLVEAMAMRKAVVASRAGGPLEILEDGRTGFLVAPGDDVTMALRILKLLGSPELARQMGEAASKSTARFDVRLHMEKVHAIYAGMT